MSCVSSQLVFLARLSLPTFVVCFPLQVYRYTAYTDPHSLSYISSWSIIATMKSVLTAGLLVSALSLQQAAATSWGDAPSFSNPSNTNNNCSADQQSGFDWSGLPTGGFSNYGGFGFSGFSCQNSFQPNSKRSLRTRTGFQVSRGLLSCLWYLN